MENYTSEIELINSIDADKSIEYILSEAYKIFGNPILAHDMGYKVIAASRCEVDDDPIWNEFIKTGTVGLKTLEFYKNECFFEAAANVPKVVYLVSNKLKYRRIFGKLFTARKIQVGAVCLVECTRAFSENTTVLFEVLCDKINEHLISSEYYREYGEKSMKFLINELIEDGIKDKLLYTAHIESLYTGLYTDIYMAVVNVSKSGKNIDYFMKRFKEIRDDFKYTSRGENIIILMSVPEGQNGIKIIMEPFKEIIEKHNAYAAVSTCFGNLYSLSKYYKKVEAALNGSNNAGVVFVE